MSCIVLIHPDPLQQDLLYSLLHQDHDEVCKYAALSDSLNMLSAHNDSAGIILDLSLLDDSWWSFQNNIRRRELGRDRHVPILGLSPHYGKAEADQICHEFQLDRVLPLPIDPSRFRQSVKNVFNLQATTLFLSRY